MKAKPGLKFEFIGETPNGEIKSQIWEVKTITAKFIFIQSVTFPGVTSKLSQSLFNKFIKKNNVVE